MLTRYSFAEFVEVASVDEAVSSQTEIELI